MIEIGLGILIVAGVLAVLAGVGGLAPGASGIDVLPLLGYGGIAILLATGALLIADGLARRAIKRHPERRHALRTARLTTVALLATAGLAIGLPLAAGPANLIRIEGMPLGYYLAAQGALIGLAIMAFVWAARQNRVDAEERGHE
jgi:putative solute:sodium symporter small subunit